MAQEKKLQDKIINDLKRKNIWYLKKVADGKTGRGCPDLIICLDGRFVALELKAPNGKLSQAQIVNAKMIKKSGGEAYVIRCYEEYKQLVSR